MGAREAHVHLHADFLARAKGAAVDLGDEDGRGDAVEEVQDGDVVARDGRLGGREGFLERGDVDVAEEVVRVCAVEDDDFGWGGRAVRGLECSEEGEEVGEEGGVDEVDRRVVEGDARYVASVLGGEGLITG